MTRSPDSRLLPIIFPRSPMVDKDVLPWSQKLMAALAQLAVSLNLFVRVNYVYVGGSVSGTANALTIEDTFPEVFTLSVGTFITFIPSQVNLGPATLNVQGSGDIEIRKPSPSGLIPLGAGNLVPTPIAAQYNGTYWIAFNIPYAADPALMTGGITLGVEHTYGVYISNGARTVTLGLSALYPSFMWTEFLAIGGDITITPDASETVQTGAAGVSYTLASGSRGKLYHTSGKWWVF